MKKFFLIFFLIVICAVAGLFLWLYIDYMKNPETDKSFLLPKIEMSVIEISSLTAEKTEMTVSVLMKNTLPFTFHADNFSYRIYMNDAEIVKSRYEKQVTLAADDSSWIGLPVTVYNHDVDSVIKANEKRGIDSIEYRMNATFSSDLIFRKHFDVTIKRFLPLMHLPDLQVEKVEIDSLNFKRAIVLLHAEIRNDNVFDIKVKDYSYEVQIEDHEWVKGMLKGLTVLKSKATTAVDVPVTLSLKEVEKTLFQLLKKGKNVNYKLVLKMTLASDVDMLKNSHAVIKSSGSVKSLLKAVKGGS